MDNKKFYGIVIGILGAMLLVVVIFMGIIMVQLNDVKNADNQAVGEAVAEPVASEKVIQEDGGQSEQVTNDKPKEIMAQDVTTVREIVSKENFYIGKEVTIGAVKVFSHDIGGGAFTVRTSYSEEFTDYDKDVSIKVMYNELPEAEQWYRLSSEGRPIIYTKGIVRQYRNSSDLYIVANAMAFDYETFLSKTAGDNLEGESTTNIEQMPNSEFLTYSNNRYGFSIEYPDIFPDYWESDNGDGISLENSETGIQLLVYGANNVMDERPEELYKADLENKPKVLYKLQKDNWYVISWEDGDQGFYEKTVVGKGSMNTFRMSYPKKDDEAYSGMVEHLFKTFRTPAINTGH